jgi:hypothetical protein
VHGQAQRLSKLDDVAAARTAHAVYFAGVLEHLRPTMPGSPDQMAVLAVADEAIDDLRAAIWFASNLTVDGYDDSARRRSAVARPGHVVARVGGGSARSPRRSR